MLPIGAKRNKKLAQAAKGTKSIFAFFVKEETQEEKAESRGGDVGAIFSSSTPTSTECSDGKFLVSEKPNAAASSASSTTCNSEAESTVCASDSDCKSDFNFPESAVQQIDASGVPQKHFPAVPSFAVCSTCGTDVQVVAAKDQTKCNDRITAKSNKMYKRPKCNYLKVKLWRKFGSWPPPAVRDMQQQERQQFYKALGDNTTEDLSSLTVKTLVSIKVQSEEAKTGGEYLPVSVYEARGYHIQRIMEFCPHKKNDPVLGEVYKVEITGEWKSTIEKTVKKELDEWRAVHKKGQEEKQVVKRQ